MRMLVRRVRDRHDMHDVGVFLFRLTYVCVLLELALAAGFGCRWAAPAPWGSLRSGAVLSSCVSECRPQPLIPAGWIWFHYFDPVSEFCCCVGLNGHAAGCVPAACSQCYLVCKRCPAAYCVGPLHHYTAPTDFYTPCCLTLPPRPTAGFSLYGLIASQLGDVTTLTELPSGEVRPQPYGPACAVCLCLPPCMLTTDCHVRASCRC